MRRVAMHRALLRKPSPGRIAAFVFLVLLLTLYGNVMPFGRWAFLIGAGIGLAWGALVVRLTAWLERSGPAAEIAASTAVLFSTIGMACLTGSGFIYTLLFGAVLEEPSTTYAALSALMRPTVPYFIALNGALELLLVPIALALNWSLASPRGRLVAAAAFLYWVMRAWTYIAFADQRVSITQAPLSDIDVAWFRETLKSDCRVYMAGLATLLFGVAALQAPLAKISR
jgi:hypothetical protein